MCPRKESVLKREGCELVRLSFFLRAREMIECIRTSCRPPMRGKELHRMVVVVAVVVEIVVGEALTPSGWGGAGIKSKCEESRMTPRKGVILMRERGLCVLCISLSLCVSLTFSLTLDRSGAQLSGRRWKVREVL